MNPIHNFVLFCKIHFDNLFVCSSLQNDLFPTGVQSKSCTISLLHVCYIPCPSHRLSLKFWQFILEHCLSVLTKNMDCSTILCLLLIYSVESWLIRCNGQDLLLRKTRSCWYCVYFKDCMWIFLTRTCYLALLLPTECNPCIIKEKCSFVAVFCQHWTHISIFFSWFVYSFTRCC